MFTIPEPYLPVVEFVQDLLRRLENQRSHVAVLLQVLLTIVSGNAEVNDPHLTQVFVVANHDIGRLQVPVYDVFFSVQVSHALEDTLHNGSALFVA